MTVKLLTYYIGGAAVFISVNSEVKCNSTDVSKEVLHIGRTKEEVDTKIIVHVKNCLLNSFRNLVVQTVDTNVLTLLLAHLSLLDSPYEIEVDINFGKDRRHYKINDICWRITPKQEFALLFFFTFTGCDIISSLFDISKSTWWNVWHQNAYITETFTKLSWTPDKVEENDLNLIKNMYVLLMTHIMAFIRTTLTDCGSLCLQSGVKTNWESFPRQGRLWSFIFYIQRKLLVGYEV